MNILSYVFVVFRTCSQIIITFANAHRVSYIFLPMPLATRCVEVPTKFQTIQNLTQTRKREGLPFRTVRLDDFSIQLRFKCDSIQNRFKLDLIRFDSKSIQTPFQFDSIRFNSNSIQIRFDSIRLDSTSIRFKLNSNSIRFKFD